MLREVIIGVLYCKGVIVCNLEIFNIVINNKLLMKIIIIDINVNF